MEAFKPVTSKVTPLPIADVDTDMIIPAAYLTSTSREGYGENCFRRLRDENPDFPLNNSKYEGNEILIAHSNFGCGSSREHAVWALMAYGFKVIIAPNFADIFKANSGKNGLLLIELPEEIVENLLKTEEEITVDLATQTLTTPEESISFDVDPFRKECILKGHDDLDYLLSHIEDIEAWMS